MGVSLSQLRACMAQAWHGRPQAGLRGSVGHQRGYPGGAAPLTSRPRCPTQSYCLKVKEMDDEEYSCIVSFQGRLGVGGGPGAGKWWHVHTFPSLSHRDHKCPGAARGTGWLRPTLERPGHLAELLFLGVWGCLFPPRPPWASELRGGSPRLGEADFPHS